MHTTKHPCAIFLVIASCFHVGCGGPLYRNDSLVRYDKSAGYRFDNLALGEHNTDDLFICLSFSGGGTRAAAFAYGVLEGLRDAVIEYPAGDSVINDPAGDAVINNPEGDAGSAGGGEVSPRPTRLLDEVDVISAVSGGSFAAVGYGLWGDDIFDGTFKKRVLTRNMQGDLLLRLLKPINLLLVPFVLLDRIDIAAYYYDEAIFDRQTYADLLERPRPFVVVNATDMSRRQRFEFTQDDFDLLGSDLTTLPVGWAVAASSAFPVLLSPLRFRYFPDEPMAAAIRDAIGDGALHSNRRSVWAESLLVDDRDETETAARDGARPIEIDARNHRYLYLLDGGLADNLGLSYFFESYRRGSIRARIDAGRIRRLVVIIADASSEPPIEIERRSSAPGLFKVFERTGTTVINTHSATLKAIARYVLLEAQLATREVYERCREVLAEHCPDAEPPRPPPEHEVEAYVIDLSFQDVKDKRKRRSLLSLVTCFFLPSSDVETLIEAGGELLRQHPEFRRLMQDLREDR